jgi:hypothetical protein
MIVHAWGGPPYGRPTETGAFQHKETSMKTAMIAAFSCALLASFSVSALQCPMGQAVVTVGKPESKTRPPVGDGPTLSATSFATTVVGMSEVGLAELTSSHRIQTLEMMVGYKGRDPVPLKFSYLAQGMGKSCAYFRSFQTEKLERNGILRVEGADGNAPELCFDGPNRITAALTVEINTVALLLGKAIDGKDITVQVLAHGEDDDSVALIDSDGSVCSK